jgi:hypothetical protein
MFFIKDGGQVGFMRKSSKSLCLELSYGDEFIAVLYESMKGDQSEIVIYETKEVLNFFASLNGKEGDEEQCKRVSAF